MDIDLGAIPDNHKGEFRNGWYHIGSGLFVSPLVMAKHRMTGDPPAQFTYERWRHGGWYVGEITWPNGGCGCVSRNFHDRKWRIACDPRTFEVQPTFRTRDDAARGEWLFVKGLVEEASLASEEVFRGGRWVRVERTVDGALQEHSFDEAGYDVWGYDRNGRYDGPHDRAPFQRSPFPTEHEIGDTGK